MDRFIVNDILLKIQSAFALKSNMDRFIEGQPLKDNNLLLL